MLTEGKKKEKERKNSRNYEIFSVLTDNAYVDYQEFIVVAKNHRKAGEAFVKYINVVVVSVIYMSFIVTVENFTTGETKDFVVYYENPDELVLSEKI